SLTTNGILLLPLLDKLRTAGLNRLTISIDSLKPERFTAITRGGDFHRVWRSILTALDMGFEKVKLNIVMMRGINDDEPANSTAPMPKAASASSPPCPTPSATPATASASPPTASSAVASSTAAKSTLNPSSATPQPSTPQATSPPPNPNSSRPSAPASPSNPK